VAIASVKLTQLAWKAIVLCEYNCEITRNYDRTGPFIVIQCPRCWYPHRKPVCDFLFVNNTNLYPILHLFRIIMTRIGEIITFNTDTSINFLVRGEPLNSVLRNL